MGEIIVNLNTKVIQLNDFVISQSKIDKIEVIQNCKAETELHIGLITDDDSESEQE